MHRLREVIEVKILGLKLVEFKVYEQVEKGSEQK